MVTMALPRRDGESRRHLLDVARNAAPVSLARERVIPIAGAFGALWPEGGLRRGSVVAVDGVAGAGVSTVALRLLAAATAAGEWVAAVELGDSFGGCAAIEAGIATERCAVARRVPAERWPAVVAALLDGIGVVAAVVPYGVRTGEARRLAARARERGSVLVAVCGVVGTRTAQWPAEAGVRCTVGPSRWRGLEAGSGLLAARALAVRVEGRGAPRHGEFEDGSAQVPEVMQAPAAPHALAATG